MNENDEMSTNDDVKQRPAKESTTPEIRVRTKYCIPRMPEIECELDEPEGGRREVPEPYKVNIVNDRNDCTGADRTLKWQIGRGLHTLEPGQSTSHQMTDDEETLELFYDNCRLYETGSPGVPEPPTTPRVTINLIKSRNE